MSNLHPIIQQAIAPFIRPMTHLRRIPPLESYVYELNGVYLACEIEFEKGERQTNLEPGWPDDATLWKATTESGDDVTEILSDEQREEIESAFLQQDQEY